MRIDGPTNPFHIAAAYGLRPQAPVARPAPTTPTSNVSAVRNADAVANIARTPDAGAVSATARLVAAVVPGRIDFTADQPVQTSALPMYRHPADRNTAATMVALGRSLDIEG